MSETDPTARLPWRQRVRLWRRHWEHRVRNQLLSFLRGVITAWSGRRAPPPPASSAADRNRIRNILIIRTGKAIGDAVLSLVLIPECRRLFPSARVNLLLRDHVAPLFSEGTGADAVLELHPRFLRWPLATGRLLAALRRQRYDMVIVCDQPLKSSFTALCLALWTGAAWRVGFENEESRPFLTVRVPARARGPIVQHLLGLLSSFGKPRNEILPRLEPSSRWRKKSDGILGDGAGPVLIFIPDHWRKSWPMEAFLRLAAEITSRQQRVLLAFGPADLRGADPSVQEWIRTSKGLGSVLPPQSLPLFAAILARCRLFISNDCGPYHIAVAVGAPCVAAFVTREALEDFGYQSARPLVAVHHCDLREAERLALNAILEILAAPG